MIRSFGLLVRRVLAFDAPVPPSLDLSVIFLLRLDTVLGLTRVPDSASVMSSTRRTEIPARYISISADRALPPAVAFDDRRLEGLAPQLWDPKIDVARLDLQRPFVAARPCILPSFAALIPPGRPASASCTLSSGAREETRARSGTGSSCGGACSIVSSASREERAPVYLSRNAVRSLFRSGSTI